MLMMQYTQTYPVSTSAGELESVEVAVELPAAAAAGVSVALPLDRKSKSRGCSSHLKMGMAKMVYHDGQLRRQLRMWNIVGGTTREKVGCNIQPGSMREGKTCP